MEKKIGKWLTFEDFSDMFEISNEQTHFINSIPLLKMKCKAQEAQEQYALFTREFPINTQKSWEVFSDIFENVSL